MIILKKRSLLLALACVMTVIPAVEVAAFSTSPEQTITFDLTKGNVNITSTTYSGYNSSGNLVSASGVQCSKYLFVIRIPNQSPVTDASNASKVFIKNPEKGSRTSSVSTVITQWHNSGRTRTNNNISVSSTDANPLTIQIEDCFSTFHEKDGGGQRTSGGLSFMPQHNSAKLEVRLKGDNRFGNVFYTSGSYSDTKLIFTSADGDGALTGTLTVADINIENVVDTPGLPDNSPYQPHNVGGSVYFNWYNSVIGGSDGGAIQDSRGIVINGGTIYAGAMDKDNCTAIGAGGNGYGTVTINGGYVTAVTSSTGTAIGGGIGWTDVGGASDVVITGGEVYAYNHGFVHLYSNDAAGLPMDYQFVPAAAIGGGSSFMVSCDPSTIKISGGTVYAQSVGGVAIGGGGSGVGNAGNATVEISGGTVYASNIGGEVKALTDETKLTIPAGTSIGGGTGGVGFTALGDGGSATVKIGGDAKLIAGSIGGGSTNSRMDGSLGYAKIEISGNPLIQGQFMMKKAVDPCEFKMYGGTINNSQTPTSVPGDPTKDKDHYNFLQYNGGALCMIDETAKATITAGSIYGSKARLDSKGEQGKGGAVYMSGGKFTMTGGTIGDSEYPNIADSDGGAVYIDKPSSGHSTFIMDGNECAIIYNQSGGDGGAVYVADGSFTVINGTIAHNTAHGDGGGAYVARGTVVVNDGNISDNHATTGNGGGIYTTSNVDVTGTSKINNNTSALSGGGVFVKTEPGQEVVVNISSSSTACEINDNDANGSHDSTCGGGGIYLSSGTVNLTNATVDNNKAIGGLGGGIYVGSGTINVISGSSSYNMANDGGGLYAGGGYISFEGGGKISHNTVTHNGGGVFGSSANITFKGENSNYAEISYNKAMNGAGIYMTQGATMSVTAALVNGNEAVVVNKNAEGKPTPAVPLSAYWSYTKDSGSNNKDNLQGIGGGVYLDSGVDNEHHTKLEFVTDNLVSLGIYANTAEIAADDIFANGDFTHVIIPAVDDMKFERFDGKPTGWYEDYMTNDVAYGSGTYENNRNGATGIRYRTAYQSGQNMFKVDNNKASAAGRYICLALGDPFASLLIKVTGLKKGESAVYTCTKYGDDKPTYYVIITGTSDSGEEVSRIINNVPIGDWCIEQTDWSWSYDLSSPKVQFGKVGVDATEIPTFSFSNTADTSASSHGESIKNNVFSTVVTAVDIVTVTPRDKNNGENNKNIDL